MLMQQGIRERERQRETERDTERHREKGGPIDWKPLFEKILDSNSPL